MAAVVPTIETYRDVYTTEIEEIERKMAALATTRETLITRRAAVTSADTSLPLPEVCDMMKRISETIDELMYPCPIYVLPKRTYGLSATPADLIGADAILFYEIKKIYPGSTIVARGFSWEFSVIDKYTYRKRVRDGKTDLDRVTGATIVGMRAWTDAGVSEDCKIIQWDPDAKPPSPGYLYDESLGCGYNPTWSIESTVAIQIVHPAS